MSRNSYVDSTERQLATQQNKSFTTPFSPSSSLHSFPPFLAINNNLYIFLQTSQPQAFFNTIHTSPPLPTTHECNSIGTMLMMMTSSNSSSSGCENDVAAAAAAATGEKKRRFSEAQVKSMEVMFEEQAKLEPRKKQQLAKELGLQPRQVAIWFQNKRARWKSKQLERAYAALAADYDALRSSFDSLLRQKNVLSMQVQRLAEILESKRNQKEKNEGKKQTDECTVVRGGEADQTQRLSLLSSKADNSDVEKKVNHLSVGKEVENTVQRTKEQAGGGRVFVSDDSVEQKQFSFHSNVWPSDQVMSTGGGFSQWWEFLPYE